MNELLRQILFLPEQASHFAQEVDRLHYFVILTTMVMSTGVGLGSLFFFVRYRRREPNQKTPHIEPKVWIEVLFVVVPLSFFLLWFWIGYRQFVMLSTPPSDSTDVYVMAKQWMWKFNYPDGPSSLGVLRVPVGRPVRLLLTSRDVIHSFYVPAFRVKQDALPGRYTQTWFKASRPGSYHVFCAEYCGLSHSRMSAEVVALDAKEFDAWYADQRRGLKERQDSQPTDSEPVLRRSDLVAEGRQLSLTYGCVKCHTADGTQHIGPTWRNLYGRAERLDDGTTVLVDEAYLTESMMDPRAKVVAGFKPVMPSFRSRLSPAESAALVEYIKSLKGDQTPSEADLR